MLKPALMFQDHMVLQREKRIPFWGIAQPGCTVKVNVQNSKAGKTGVEAGLQAGAKSVMALIPYEIEAMKAVVREKIRIFGSDGRL